MWPKLLACLALLAVVEADVGNVTRGFKLQLWPCAAGEKQSWLIQTDPYPNHTITLRQDQHFVIDISQFSNESDAIVQLWQRNAFKAAYNQQFRYDVESKQIVSLMNGFCLTVFGPDLHASASISMEKCSKANQDRQMWSYHADTGTIEANNSGLCIDAGSAVVGCTVAPFSSYPYCNYTLSVPERVEDLIKRLTVDEKAQFLSADKHTNGGVPRLQVKPFLYGECLHGVNVHQCGAVVNGSTSTGCATSFPHALGLGATFNRSLWTEVATIISTEARALYNQGLIGLSFWAPDINLFRDPRWGRGQEVPGEDPFLTAEYVAHYSRALQEGDDPRYLKTISSCKHFSAYDLENWENVTRTHFNAIVSEQDLVEYYWVPFRSCVERAHAQSIMCSYNAVNGVPSCANSLFQNDIVRGEWGFDGFFVSDCGGINVIYASHNYTNSTEGACKLGIEAGTDTNCGKSYEKSLAQTVKDGMLTEAQLDVSVRRVMAHMFRLGYMDPDEIQPYRVSHH